MGSRSRRFSTRLSLARRRLEKLRERSNKLDNDTSRWPVSLSLLRKRWKNNLSRFGGTETEKIGGGSTPTKPSRVISLSFSFFEKATRIPIHRSRLVGLTLDKN